MTALGDKAPSKLFLRVILIIAGASFLLVLAVLYFAFSQATVTLYTAEEPAETSFTAAFQSSSQEADPADLSIVPGRIEVVELSDTKEIASVGEKPVPDFATVEVTIFNSQGGAQGLLPRTQLVNEDGIKFRTDQSVNVPAGGSITVGATADQKGVEYNIAPSRFSIIKLSSELQQLVYAESTEAATGGEKVLTVVTEDDITAAQDNLITELEQRAEDQLKTSVSGTEQYLPEAIAKEVTKKESDVEADVEIDAFEVSVTVKVSAAIFDENSLLQLAIAKLKASLPETRELVTYDPNSFEYSVTGLTDSAPQLQGSLQGIARLRLPTEVFVAQDIAGMTKKSVQEHYGQFEEIARVEIDLTPFWAFMMPTFEDRITIQIGESASVQQQSVIAE